MEDKTSKKQKFRMGFALSLFFLGIILFILYDTYSYIIGQYLLALKFITVLFLGLGIIIFLSNGIILFGKKNGIEKDITALISLFRVFSFSVLVILLLYLLNINITSLLVGAGFAGIVLGMAAQTTLSNIFAGLMLITTKHFKSGDMVKITTWQYPSLPATYPHDEKHPGISGKVTKVGLVYTQIIGEDKVPMFIPNNFVVQALIYNENKASGRKVSIRIELNRNKSFAEFSKIFIREIRKNKQLNSKILGMKINIEDINLDYYGIFINYKTNYEYIEMTSNKVKSLALSVSSKI
ncbi:MAG: mechanosensitive ion channel family protein [Candidatus Marsarchaeota archaeon]|nr:mechanosensitive ion channel family protein [Candidatus Marsarchaeota archaeon]